MVHYSECSTAAANCNTEMQPDMSDGTVEHFPGVQNECDGDEQQWILEGERELHEACGLAPDHAARPHAEVGDEPGLLFSGVVRFLGSNVYI